MTEDQSQLCHARIFRTTNVLQQKTLIGNVQTFDFPAIPRSGSSTLREVTLAIHLSRRPWKQSHLKWHLRLNFWRQVRCFVQSQNTGHNIFKGIEIILSDCPHDASNFLLSRSSFGTRVLRSFHPFDKMLVAIESLVGSNERIWQRRQSGRSLILSNTAYLSLSFSAKYDLGKTVWRGDAF